MSPAPRKRLYRKKRLKRAGADFYIDPVFATELLLQQERFTGKSWDPCCGIGHVAQTMRAAGHQCVATDLHDRGFGDIHNIDFLEPSIPAFVGANNIVCNPPYDRAEEFIHRALEIARGKVAMILQEKFVFSEGRYLLFAEETPLSRILFFSSRPSMPPGELYQQGKVKAGGGTINYLWMIWDHAQPRVGERWAPPTAGWLIKPEALERERRRRDRARANEEQTA